MNNVFAILLAPLLTISVALSAIEYSSLLKISRLPDPDRILSNVSGDLNQRTVADAPNLYVADAEFEDAAMLPLSDPSIAYKAARLLYRTGLLERDNAQRIQFFCRAIAQLGVALTRQPTNSRLLINWANLRQLLADVSCGRELTDGDYQAVARYALERDPTNAEVLFSSAQILLWAGKRAEALEQLRGFLEIAQTINQRQYDFIEQQLLSPEDVSALLPPRFPQIVDWSQRIHTRKPALFREATAALADLQREALAANDAALKRGEVPSQLYFDRLSSLLEVVGASSIRQLIDGELSRYYGTRGQERLQRYLDKRRSTTTLDLVRSVLYNDTRPQKSPLVNWQPDETVTANVFYVSTGFYLPRGSMIDVIELVGDVRAALVPTLSFKLFASDNNQIWDDITSKVAIESLDYARHSRLIITVPPMNYRYWKIHFGSSSRDGGFSNRLDMLVRAYGRVATHKEGK